MKRWFVLIVTILAGCHVPAYLPAPSGKINVAVYADSGCWKTSITACVEMFEWMGYEVTEVNAQHIQQDGLAGFSILCVPGGNMYVYSTSLGSKGINTIRRFVKEGGGYIGICGGAYIAGREVYWKGNRLDMEPLAIFPGVTRGPDDALVPYPDLGMVQINVDTNHPVTRGEPDSAWIAYYWGPVLYPDSETESGMAVLGRYNAIGDPAMIAFTYGKGRAFIIGTHPEIEEDSDRDGLPPDDSLSDRGSDWELMEKAALWCLGK